MACLDSDVSVRSKALALVSGMVSRSTLAELVHKLLGQLSSAEAGYRDEVVRVILSCCRADGFAHVPSFKWLVSTLFTLASHHSTSPADSLAVAEMLLEVTLRVPTVRAFAAQRSHALLLASAAKGHASPPATAALLAAAWVLGEHSSSLAAAELEEALRGLLHPRADSLPHTVQAAFMQAALRAVCTLPAIAAAASSQGNELCSLDGLDGLGLGGGGAPTADLDALAGTLDAVASRARRFVASEHIEVAERASTLLGVLELGAEQARVGSVGAIAELVAGLAPELKAVAKTAQRKVKPQPGISLDVPIYTPPPAEPPSPSSLAFPPPAATADTDGYAVAAQGDGLGSVASGGAAPAPRPSHAGPYYLGAGAPVTPQSAPHEALSFEKAAAPDAAAATPVATPAAGDEASETSWQAALAAVGGFESEGQTAVNLDEEMPSPHESDADDGTNAGGAGADATSPAGGAPASHGGMLLMDMLAAEPAVAPDEVDGTARNGKHGKRRRRRSTKAEVPGGVAGEAARASFPL